MDDLDDYPAVPSGASEPTEVDLTDEAQDFRFLTNLSLTNDTPTLPRRGEKDFEPHGTVAQQDILSASRSAMHDALSYPRTHNPKTNIIGTFKAESGETIIEKPSGSHFKTLGKGLRDGRISLLPEETLYLLERGGLDVRLRSRELGTRVQAEQEKGEEGKKREGDEWPMSLQAAYTFLIGSRGLTLERYIVYAGLKRSGYIVLRAPGWEGEEESPRVAQPPVPEPPGLWGFLYGGLFQAKAKDPPPSGPLVGKGLWRSYDDIYRRLSLIPWHDPSMTEPCAPHHVDPCYKRPAPQLRPIFHVYKPTPTFRKSWPGPPDFYIAVLNARVDPFPILSELSDLLEFTPFSPPPKETEGKVYQKLRHGYRNVLMAVVDQGVVSYIRVGDAGFGKEPVYQSAGRGREGKRGGGGSRGRGRGRAPGR